MSKLHLAAFLTLAVLFAGCAEERDTSVAERQMPAADNTARNVRDRNEATPTPMDQALFAIGQVRRSSPVHRRWRRLPQTLANQSVSQRDGYVPHAPSKYASTPFCTCMRLPACWTTTLFGLSITPSVTSSPRWAGRQCMK